MVLEEVLMSASIGYVASVPCAGAVAFLNAGAVAAMSVIFAPATVAFTAAVGVLAWQALKQVMSVEDRFAVEVWRRGYARQQPIT
jgi:hypothetical protein